MATNISVTIEFDENITKVYNDSAEWTTSGQTKTFEDTTQNHTFIVVLKDSYVIDYLYTSLYIPSITENTFRVSSFNSSNSIKVYSKQVTILAKGTYSFNETIQNTTTESTTYLISGESLTNIANAIRGVNGETNKYTPDEMKTKISALKDPKGSVTIAVNGTYDVSQKATAIVEVPATPTQEKNFTISDNNTYSVEPDTGYALSKVLVTGKFSNPTLSGTATASQVLKGATFYSSNYTKQTGTIETYSGTTNVTSNQTLATSGKYMNSNIIVNVPATPTQEKSVTITENGTTEVTPDSGKNLSKVTITTNVPSSGGVEEVSTNAEMTAKLTSENVGKYYKFTGTTDSEYVNGDLYLVELPQLSTPTGVTIDGTTLSWDEVENAESYDVYADGVLIGNTTGGGTSVKHYLNFSGDGLFVEVNGTAVTSGYELQSGDVIQLNGSTDNIGIKSNSTVTINGTTYNNFSATTLDLSNTDINITYTVGSGFGPYVDFTINYTQ